MAAKNKEAEVNMMGGWVDNSESNDYIDEYLDLDNMDTDDDIIDYSKLNRYRYFLDMKIIIDENKDNGTKAEEIDLAINEIADFVIEHDYRANFYPILRTNLVLKTHVCKKLQNNKNTVKFKITFYNHIYEEILDNEETDEKEIIFEGLFQPLFMNIVLETTGDITTAELEDASLERRRQLEVYLFNLNHINENKKIINFIAKDCSPKNAVGHILNQVNLDAVIMENPTITTEYDQIIVPPKNFKNAIQTISEHYGLFNEGFRQYLDFKRYYLLDNKINKKIPVEKNEFPNIYINVASNRNAGKLKVGSYVDKKNECYFINTPNNIQAYTHGSLEKEVIGSKMRIYERKRLENALTYDEKSKKFSIDTGYIEQEMGSDGYMAKLPSGEIVNDKISYAYNSNELESARVNMQMNSKYNNLEFTLTLIDIDISFMTLNKRFIFKFQDLNTAKLYNGIYMMEKMINGYSCIDKTVYTMCKFIRVE